MKNKCYLLVVLMVFCIGVANSQIESEIPVPTQAQLEWQNAELVTVFHYDLHVFDGEPYVQRENRITPISDHNIFKPRKLDTDQWIRAAKAMGAKIAILTATHETGFALYQSDVNPYCLKAVNWRNGEGDVVREFVVEGKTSGGWKKLTGGSCIGHKYIDTFDVEEVSQVRLVISESLAEPVIKKFAVY